MAKVFKGKIVIPVAQMEEVFKLMEQAEKARQPFMDFLSQLSQEFSLDLAKKYTKATARKHKMVVDLFIDFLCRYTDVETLSEVTRGMVKSEFNSWWKRKVWDATTETDRRVALKKFFSFLAEQKNIVNETVISALK